MVRLLQALARRQARCSSPSRVLWDSLRCGHLSKVQPSKPPARCQRAYFHYQRVIVPVLHHSLRPFVYPFLSCIGMCHASHSYAFAISEHHCRILQVSMDLQMRQTSSLALISSSQSRKFLVNLSSSTDAGHCGPRIIGLSLFRVLLLLWT